MNIETFQKIGVGAIGVGGTELVTQAVTFNPQPITEFVGIVTQIIIGIASLIALFRKNKSNNQNQ